jgi:putative transposase
MLPLRRRSWSLRGHPPVLKYKSGHREKVSVAAALWLTPRRDRLGLSYQTLRNGYFNNRRVASFLERLLRQVGPLVVVWDGGTMHKGDPIRALLKRHRGRLAIEAMPPQGAELMPVEQLWTWLKYGKLSDFAPENAGQLQRVIRGIMNPIRHDQKRLRGFFHASDLPLPRALRK